MRRPLDLLRLGSDPVVKLRILRRWNIVSYRLLLFSTRIGFSQTVNEHVIILLINTSLVYASN